MSKANYGYPFAVFSPHGAHYMYHVEDVLRSLGDMGDSLDTIKVDTPKGRLEGSAQGIATRLRDLYFEKYSIRCLSVSEPWNQAVPATLGWFEGKGVKSEALARARELAMDMRDSLVRRLEEPFTAHELADIDAFEIVCDRTGQPKVRYEVINERRIEDHRARAWMR